MENLPTSTQEVHFKSKTFGGYSKNEVNSYVAQLQATVQNLQQENARLKCNMAEKDKELQQTKKMEASLLKALNEAQNLQKHIELQSKKEAHIEMMKTRHKAEVILREAKDKAGRILKEANTQYHDKLEALRQDIKYLEGHYNLIDGNANMMIDQMTAIAEDMMDRVNKFSSKKNVANYEHQTIKIKQTSDASKQPQRNAEANNNQKLTAQAVVSKNGTLSIHRNGESSNAYAIESPENFFHQVGQ